MVECWLSLCGVPSSIPSTTETKRVWEGRMLEGDSDSLRYLYGESGKQWTPGVKEEIRASMEGVLS